MSVLLPIEVFELDLDLSYSRKILSALVLFCAVNENQVNPGVAER